MVLIFQMFSIFPYLSVTEVSWYFFSTRFRLDSSLLLFGEELDLGWWKIGSDIFAFRISESTKYYQLLKSRDYNTCNESRWHRSGLTDSSIEPNIQEKMFPSPHIQWGIVCFLSRYAGFFCRDIKFSHDNMGKKLAFSLVSLRGHNTRQAMGGSDPIREQIDHMQTEGRGLWGRSHSARKIGEENSFLKSGDGEKQHQNIDHWW